MADGNTNIAVDARRVSNVPVEYKDLHLPPLQELTSVLQLGLEQNFADVSVTVVDCPDLMQHPWTLASPGICGKTRLVDVGGVPYLIPLPDLTRFYNFKQVADLIDLPEAFFIGAGAGDSRSVGMNCEMMANTKIGSDHDGPFNQTKFAKVHSEDGSCILIDAKSNNFNLLGNFLASEGKRGKVLEIKACKRTGNENFVSCMRKCLKQHYGTRPIGLGGAFQIERGNAKLHVMPPFSKKPLQSDEDVERWLKFYEMKPPLICLSVLISHDPGLDLRMDHTHCFSHHGEGGHYHYDTTPEEICYHGYYTPAEFVYRVDRPTQTHLIGRD